MRKLLLNLSPFLFIFLTSVFFLGKTLGVDQDHIIYGGDLLTQFYFWKGFLLESVKNGTIPFWNPYLFSGTPFLSHPSIAFFYPLTYLSIILPFSVSFSWIYLIHLLIGGYGIYFFSRNYSDKVSSTIASVIFVCSGYFAARIYAGHIDLFTTAVWIPWVMGGVVRKKYNLAIISLILLILAGYSAYLVFTLEFLGIYAVSKFILRRKNYKKNFLNIFLIIAVAILIGAISWVPVYSLAKNSIRRNGLPYETASWGSLPLSGLKLFITPLDRSELNKISFNLGGGPKENPFDHFVGVLPLFVIFVGIVLKLVYFIAKKKNLKRDSPYQIGVQDDEKTEDFWIFLLVCGFVLWVSFGFFSPLNLHKFLYTYISVYKMMRIPLQHLVLAVVLIPIMVGMILNSQKTPVKIVIAIALVLELYMFGKPFVFDTTIPDLNSDQELSWMLSKNELGTRVLPNYRVVSPVLHDLDLNAPMKNNLFTTSGYDPVILDNYYTFIKSSSGYPDDALLSYNVEIPPISLRDDLLKYLGVSKIILEKENGASIIRNYEKIKSEERYDLWKRNDDARFYFFTDTEVIYDKNQEILDDLKTNKSDISKVILTSRDDKNHTLPELPTCPSDSKSDQVVLIEYSNNVYTFKTQSNCDHYLSTSIPYFPGWEASIDDQKVPLYLINSAFDGVYVNAGFHTVKIKYNSSIYLLSGGISLIGLILFGFYSYYNKKRKIND